jgi:hypothetical protein
MTPKNALLLMLTLAVGLVMIVVTAFALTRLGIDRAMLGQLLAGLPAAAAAVGAVVVSMHNGFAISESRTAIDATQAKVDVVHAKLASGLPGPGAPPAAPEVSSDGH